jgi:general secretion pathway protein B
MSYILDALKKADSERQHGKAPDIYSQQTSNNPLETEDSFQGKPIIWLLLIALIILLAAFLLFINLYRTPAAVIASSGQIVAPLVAANVPATPTVQSTPSTTMAVPASAVVAPAVVSAAAPTVTSTTPPAAAENPTPVVAAPAEPVLLQPSPKLSMPATKEKHDKRHASAPASSSTAAKKPAATNEADLAIETVSTTLRDLPLNIQNEIPTVTVGGYIYSANRAECQLLINKQLLHEGDQVAPGLLLERMMPHSAILNYKGNRYRISY